MIAPMPAAQPTERQADRTAKRQDQPPVPGSEWAFPGTESLSRRVGRRVRILLEFNYVYSARASNNSGPRNVGPQKRWANKKS